MTGTPHEASATTTPAHRWRTVVGTAALVLVVAVPSMCLEEWWGGHPMIDDRGAGWTIFALVVTAAFVAAGAIAASRAKGVRQAAMLACSGTCVAAVALVTLDIARRLAITHQSLPLDVVRLWIVAGGGAVVLATIAGAVTSVSAAVRERLRLLTDRLPYIDVEVR